MMIVYDDEEMAEYFALHVGKQKLEHPVLIDKFLENAIEVDVDALSDGEDVYVAGVMEHIEEAGIHSGDSSCVLPPYSLPAETVAEIERQTVALAKELRVVGLMNIQFAVKDGVVFILEVNPRASRTAPFVSKATGVPLPRLATQVMLGKTLKELDPWSMRRSGYVSVKDPSSRSAASPAWTSCSDLKCVPPAKSWALPRPLRKLSSRGSGARARSCRKAARCSCP